MSISATPHSPAERKRAQRARDKAALFADGVSFDSLTTAALIDHLAHLVAQGKAGTLGLALIELGRRGGVRVTAKPAAERGRRVKM